MSLTKPVLLAAAILCAPAAHADVAEAVQDAILPAYAGFADAALALADRAAQDCDADALRGAYDAAFDAWSQVGYLRLGPGETAALSLSFWPDKRGATPKALSQMMDQQDPIGVDVAEYAQASAAARGFFALEALLYDEALQTGDDPYRCQLVATVAGDLAAQAQALDQDWRAGFAAALTEAGQPDQTIYLSPQEAAQALYTQIMAGLEFTADQRLGRPLDSFDNPHPRRAEAWRSDRALPNIRLSLAAQRDLARALADLPLPATEAAFDAAFEAADRIADPGFQDIGDPQAWFRLDVLRQRVRAIREAVATELGTALGVSAGFNSADGD